LANDVKLNKKKPGKRSSVTSSGPKIIKTSADRERPAIPRKESVFEEKKHRGRHFDIGDLFGNIANFFGGIGDWCAENVKQAIIGVVVLVVLVAALIAVLIVGKDKNKQDKANEGDTFETVPEVALEKDSVAQINEMISKYYDALASGDIITLNTMRSNPLDDAERIKIEVQSKYFDSYENIEVYTKPGFTEDTFVAFVYSEAKLTDFDTLLPELQTYVIHPDGNGGYKIYEGDMSDDEEEYLVGLAGQDDVESLCNTVQAKYNEAVQNDANLSSFLVDFSKNLNNEVGEELAKLETGDDSNSENAEESPSQSIVVKSVEAKETVKVRKSDSTESEELGKVSAGTRLPLIEKKENGWSKVEYNGGEAYIKTEFLVDVLSTEEGETSDSDSSSEGDSSSSKSMKAKETVNVRKSPSTDAEALGKIMGGDTVEALGTEGDWTKIKYKDGEAYIKTEFLE